MTRRNPVRTLVVVLFWSAIALVIGLETGYRSGYYDGTVGLRAIERELRNYLGTMC